MLLEEEKIEDPWPRTELYALIEKSCSILLKFSSSSSEEFELGESTVLSPFA